ncbi:hypothetical protein AB4Z29_29400 [Paenibacillus sp. 2TAB23]|uniref:hypothetical protein n=1 Tax=Paenibacillus sp. 2TAB23 TaxID=3233004 RepID=UPI003F9AB72A
MMVGEKRKSAVVLATAYILGGLLILLACVAWFVGRTDARPEQAVVAEIEGEPVTEEEFRWVLGRERSGVIEQFKRDHKVVVDKTFWQREYDGVTPLETVKRRALDSVARMKVLLQLAERQGIIEDASYEGLLLEMERENARRAKALAAGLPVYGPSRFDWSDFADFYIGRMTIELKDKLAETVLAMTEDRLKRHYEEIKEELFRLEGETRFYAISAPYRIDGVEDGERKREAASALGEIRARLAAGEAAGPLFDELGKETAKAGESSVLHAAEERFDAASARYYYKTLPPLYELLADAPKPGTVGPILDDEANGRYMLAVVIGSEAGGYAGFEESKDKVRQHALETVYAEYVDKLTKEARIVTIGRLYEGITLE